MLLAVSDPHQRGTAIMSLSIRHLATVTLGMVMTAPAFAALLFGLLNTPVETPDIPSTETRAAISDSAETTGIDPYDALLHDAHTGWRSDDMQKALAELGSM